eukprot:4409949-Amphidinium_carterae.1
MTSDVDTNLASSAFRFADCVAFDSRCGNWERANEQQVMCAQNVAIICFRDVWGLFLLVCAGTLSALAPTVVCLNEVDAQKQPTALQDVAEVDHHP